ncbi:MAG: hypothetical protein V3U88_03135 [Methylococcales bacterium]
MTTCDHSKPTITRKKICDADAASIKKILGVDERAPLAITTFGPGGNIVITEAEGEFNSKPTELENQRFLAIVPCTYTITKGSHSVTHTVAGESNTQSYPPGY